MTRRARVSSDLTGAPVLARDLQQSEISPSRVRSADVSQPFRGVHLIGATADTLRERAEAFAPLLRPGDAFSHSTAALLWGAQLPWAVERAIRLHVTTTGAGDRFRRKGVVGHTAAVLPVTLLHGLPVVEPAHVWLQLAAQLSHADLVAVGDRWVTAQGRGRSRRPAITSADALAAAIPERARAAGRARRALAEVRVGPESRMESLLRLLLTGAGLPEPRINPALRVGDQVLHPDLLYDRWRVVFEYEGDGHRVDAEQWRHDIWRRELFEDAGWRVIRVHRDDILAEPEAFLARVCHVLAAR